MGSNSIPNKVARMLTEDPEILKESTNWQHEVEMAEEELEDAGILGDDMFYVEFTVGADWNEGEPMVRYYPDGSGYPGSPSYFEWDILKITKAEAYDENGDEVEVELTEELKKKLTEALFKHISDDEMQEHLADALEGHDEPPDRYDEYRDRQMDEPDYY